MWNEMRQSGNKGSQLRISGMSDFKQETWASNGAGPKGPEEQPKRPEGKKKPNGAIPKAKAQPENGASKLGGFFTTLVVAADFMFSAELQDFLRHEGHVVRRAETIEDALVKTRLYPPDMILLDSELEGVSVLPLLSALLMQVPSAAVVILARNPSVEESILVLQHGAADYLSRPIDFQKLRQIIEIQKVLFRD